MTIPAAVAGSLVSWPVTQFDVLCANDSELAELRTAIREFLVADREEFGWEPAVDSWLARWDAEFSARLGDAGFVGLTIPTEYGGRGLGHLHRYVVTEELLAHGAPVAAHWFADRQFAPSLLSYGSDEQRREFLPVIAAGRLHAAIGMSEHERGIRPGCGQDASESGRRRLVPQRHQGVDQRCPPGASDRRAGPHQPARSRASACRFQPILRIAGLTGHHHRSDRADGWRTPLQRGDVRRRVRLRCRRAGQHRRWLAAGHLRAGLRAQRTRTHPVHRHLDRRRHPGTAGRCRRRDRRRGG